MQTRCCWPGSCGNRATAASCRPRAITCAAPLAALRAASGSVALAPGVELLLEQAGLPPAQAPTFEVAQQREACTKQCAKAGVPIAPTWNDTPINLGTEVPGLLKTLLIDAGKPYTRVFYYRSPQPGNTTQPEGLCMALPRALDNTGDLDPLRIICVGKTSNNTCFRDNQEGSTALKIGPDETVPLARFAGGSELKTSSGGVCTACHAGRNPFVVHPKTQLALAGRNSDDWYKPLVHADWPQNPKPTADVLMNVGSIAKCNGCHALGSNMGAFPKLSTDVPQYCNTILRRSLLLTMPPDPAGALPDPDSAGHGEFLRKACRRAP